MDKLFKKILPVFVQQVVPNSLLLSRNVTLSYKILGDSTYDPPQPPIFIFHGLLGNKKQWEAIGKTIRNITERSVVIVDLRNHGDSPHNCSNAFTDQAKDILCLFEKLGATEASLIGPHMGGRTAMTVALMAPEKVSGLLVVDVSPTAPCCDELVHVMQAMTQIKLRDFRCIEKAKSAVRKHIKSIVKNDYVVQTVESNVKQTRHGKIVWACNLDVLHGDFIKWSLFPNCNKKYDGPTLFLGCQFSDNLPPDDLNAIRELFPKALVIYVPKTQHNVHIEDPKTFLELTISFLRSNIYKGPPPPHPHI